MTTVAGDPRTGSVRVVLDESLLGAVERTAAAHRAEPLDLLVAAAAVLVARRQRVRRVSVAVDDGHPVTVSCETGPGVHPSALITRVSVDRRSGTQGVSTDPPAVWISTERAGGAAPPGAVAVTVDLAGGSAVEVADAGDRARIWLDQYVGVVEALAGGRLPHLGAISLVRPGHLAVLDGPALPAVRTMHPSVPDAVRRRVVETPEAPALLTAAGTVAYGELWRRAGVTARMLADAGVGHGDRVAVVGGRGAGVVAAFLAIWGRGAVAVPIDRDYPRERRRLMAEAASAVVTVAVGEAEADGTTVLRIPDAGPSAGSPIEMEIPVHDDPAYVFFTSGTSGVPKGVLGVHGSLRQFVDWQADRFGIGAGDRVAFTKPLGFDVVLREMFVPLTTGGTAVILPHGTGPDDVLPWLARERVTVLNATPSHVSVWLSSGNDPPALPDLRWVFLAGEVLHGELVRRLRDLPRFHAEIVNLYGPTETTMVRCAHVVPPRPEAGIQPVGRPIPGSRITVLTDTGLQAGIDEIGEVSIRTQYGTRGYLNAPDEAAARFRTLPGGEIEYRTGDLGRVRPDGELVIGGRVDDQVQILGMRIEPGEVAAVLASHPGVDEAVVDVDRSGHVPRLVAHVVASASDGGLISYLLARLPAPMVPSKIVRHERLPLTQHGKVDRAALAETAASSSGRPPAEVSAEIDGEPNSDDPPALEPPPAPMGGVSDRLAELRARIESLGLDDRGRLVEELRSRARVAGPPPAGYPLSFAQARLWFLDRLHPGSPAYNIVRTTRLRGPLDLGALQAAVDGVAARHAVLRTRYEARDGEPVQVVDPPAALPIRQVDLRHVPDDGLEASIEEAVNRAGRHVFDLERGPVWAVTLVVARPDHHVLVSAVHHIATDGWSMPILAREMSEVYRAHLEGRTPDLPDLEIQYADYALRQRRRAELGELDAGLEFWRGELGGALPVLDLPADRPRPTFQTTNGGKLPFRFEGVDAEALKTVAGDIRATPFMVGLALFAAALHRMGGGNDLVIGVPSADRSWEKTAPLIGFFVNTLAIRVRLRPGMPFRELVSEVRDRCLRAYENREVPFEQVVQAVRPARDPGRTPIFQVMYQHRMGMFSGGYDFPGIEEEGLVSARDTAKFDLSCYSGVEDGAFNGIMLYNADLFDPSTVQGMIDRFEDTVRELLADPDASVSDAAEPSLPGQAVSRPRAGLPAGWEPIHRTIGALAGIAPSRPAVITGDGDWDRARLDRRARQVAAHLRSLGVGPGSRVGIHMAPSAEMVAAVLGVLAAGGAYVPVDVELPAVRKRLILEDAEPVVTLVDTIDGSLSVPVAEVAGIDGVVLDETVEVGPADPAYVIYTSGSTGRPKGVVVPHRALAAFSRSYSGEVGLGPDDRVLQFHSISFDSSVEELFPTLAAGAALVLRSGERIETISATLDWVGARRVSVFTVPTAYWHELTRHLASGRRSFPASVRAMCIGGEAARADAVAAWLGAVGRSVMLVNNYGPTEAAVIATSARLDELDDPGDPHVTIGAPLAGVRVHLLGPDGRPVPHGDEGELCIAGDQVALGYHGLPELTAERFVSEPGAGGPMYRTGDRARFRSDGLIEYLGRVDRQVKVRGHRVELDEVEAVIRRHPAVVEVAVEHDRAGDRLVAHIVPHDPADLDRLRPDLADELPGAMLPVLAIHADLPTSHAGKIDRALLGAGPPSPGAPPRVSAPMAIIRAPDRVAALRELWAEVLSVDAVSDEDDFFDLGGHSLLAVRLLSEVEARLGEEVSIRLLFEASRFDDFARRVLGGAIPASATPPPAADEPAAAPAPDGLPERAPDAAAVLREVWGEVLSVDAVSDEDDFFDLGGHSLLAVRLLSEVESRLGEEVSIRVLFEASRFGDFAARLTGFPPEPEQLEPPGAGSGEPASSTRSPATEPVPGAARREGPLSFTQERLWAADRLAPTAYHVPWGTRLLGPFDLDAFQRALDGVVARHEALRTRFPTELGTPRQVVEPPARVTVTVHDLSASPAGDREAQLAELVTSDRTAPFDLAAGPVFRAMVVRMAEEDHAVHLVVHHIAVDGRALRTVRRELAELYEAERSGRPAALSVPGIGPLDHALRQRQMLDSGAYARSLAHWRESLAGAPDRLELPHDIGPGRPVAGHVGFRLEGAARSVSSLAASRGATPYMVVLAALAGMLSRQSGSDDLLIGSPITERTGDDSAVGPYLTTLPIRLDTSGSPRFVDMVDRARTATVEALEHRAVPIDLAIGQAGRGAPGPGIQVVYDLKHAAGEGLTTFAGLERKRLPGRRGERLAKYELTVNAVLGSADLSVGIEYDAGRFSAAAAEALAEDLRAVLSSALDRPNAPLGAIDTRPGDRSLPADLGARFTEVADAFPERPAVVGIDGASLTYAALRQTVDDLAGRLRAAGVRPGSAVGLELERSVDLVVATLAVARCDAVYVPLDTGQPPDRRKRIMSAAGVGLVLSSGEAGLELTGVDVPAVPIEAAGATPLYVMFTSGSTGEPKGVVVTTRAVANLVVDTDYVSVGAGDVVAMASNPAFDAVTFELWGALLNGASLAILPPDTVMSPSALGQALERLGVTVMFVTTALFDVMARVRPSVFSPLRTLMFGGEAVNPASVRRVLEAGPPDRLLHVYGPTETTTFASWQLVEEVPAGVATVPIGVPVAGAELHVLDADRRPVAETEVGELYVGGAGLAAGYLGSPELTASRFVTVPGRGRLYRTGDLVRRNPAGAIEFVGRVDRQVKLRGLRIEPGEVEAALLAHPDVAAAVVSEVGRGDDHRLVAHLVPNEGSTLDTADIGRHLAERVPLYMIPGQLRTVERLPLTPNGKVDTTALVREVERPPGILGQEPAPVDDRSRRMLELWSHTLGSADLRLDSDFFACGGTSLSAVKLLAGVEEVFGVTVPLSRLFEARTPSRLLALVSGATGAALDSRDVVPIRADADGLPLFCLPPGGGNVFIYAPLAHHLGPLRPVLGLPARGSDGLAPPLRSIEEMAAHFLDAIGRVQPEGPVHLVGYSMAGLVAFEMARQLEASGREIGLLGLIDTSFPRNEGPADRLRRYARVAGTRSVADAARAGWMDVRSVLGKVRYGPRWAMRAALGRRLPPRLVEKRLTHAGMAAYHHYRPEPYAGDIVYFRATGLSGTSRRRPDRPWHDVAGRVEVFDVRGQHAGPRALVEEPYAAELGEHLRTVLERGPR